MFTLRLFILVLVFHLAAGFCAAQQVRADKEALSAVPEAVRARLVKRLKAYLRAYADRDIASLFELVAERTKRGLSREEFLKNVSVHPEEELIYSLRILKVSKSNLDDFVGGDRIPAPNEGDRWSVTGCGKVSVGGAKPKRHNVHFHMWLVRGEWFVERGGRAIIGGLESCD